MPSDDIAISVRNLTKTYRLFGHPGDRVKQFFSLGLKRYHQEFTALKDVSFDIRKGETVGIIGRNGSGKSTILQLICGILKPSAGTVRVSGRTSALLELGAGFNPEFTGRENVYFQGTLLGLSRPQIEDRFPSIASFADIGDFIDQPVRIYSSGMYVRLAFSVAAHVAPDILVVDEALSVGDQVFQHKSKRRVQDVIDAGATVVLVSHDRALVSSTCSRCLLLNAGELVMDGLPSDVFDYYYSLVATRANGSVHAMRLGSGRVQIRSGTGEARVEHINLLDAHGNERTAVEVGTSVVLEFLVHVHRPLPRLALAFALRDRLGQTIFSTNSQHHTGPQLDLPAGTQLRFQARFFANMGVGTYSVSSFLVSGSDRFEDNFDTHELAFFFEIHNTSHPAFSGTTWLAPRLGVERL